jgi:putative effector of murein hydrolase
MPESGSASSVDFVLRTAPIWICLFLLVTVGLPVYLATDYMMPFEVFSFTLFWVLSIQFQRYLRSSHTILRFRRLKSFLVIFANPLLVTWALGTAYMFAKKFYTGKDIDTIIGEFCHYGTLSESVIHIMRDHDVSAHLGAGDLAGLVLDAGVACMGFKMYEYRSELWASFGTVSFTCAAVAAINVFLNVIVGHGFGLQSKEAIAFASRSATLALGVPAIENLGGSTALMSTVTIFSGILFQMTGDSLFSWLRINDRKAPRTQPPRVPIQTDTRTLFGTTNPVGSTEKANASCDRGRTGEDSTVVAAGVTAGINAAAMGTAYLIERDSRATAYSALSMIMFGAATVALTALPGAAELVMSLTLG